MSTDSLGFIADAQTEIGLHDSEINDTDRDTHGQRHTDRETHNHIHSDRDTQTETRKTETATQRQR